jgi:hypothetical protein
VRLGNYASLALTVERKIDPRVLEAVTRSPAPPGSLLADFALRVLRNLDNVGDEADDAEVFLAAVRDLAEDLRRSL